MSSSKVSLWLAVAITISIVAPAAVAGMSAAIAFQSNLSKIDPTVFAPTSPVQAEAPGSIQTDVAIPSVSAAVPSASTEGLTVAVVKLKDMAADAWSAQGHDFVVGSLQTVATRTQAQVVQLVRSSGGAVLNQFWLTNSLLIAADPMTIREIAQNPVVEKIHANYAISLPPEIQAPSEPAQGPYEWNVERVRAPEAWALGIRGEGVRVCVTDTGIDPSHPDLEGRLFTTVPGDPYYPGGWMEFDSSGNPVFSQPHDTEFFGIYHGTHVSGTIAGDSWSGRAIGVAPGASLMMGLSLPNGSGTFAQVVAGMEWCVSPFDRDGNPTPPAHVQSMSWGAFGLYPELLDPTKNSLLAGIIPVAAAGNDGQGTISTPGAIWGVFAAGATDINDNVAGFSSGMTVNWPDPPADWPFFPPYPGQYIKPDFSAPGVNIRSTQPGGGYTNLDGTSMATPHISAAVALMIQASGFSLTPEQAYVNLVNSVIDMGLPGQDDRYGYGRLDAFRAVLLSLIGNTGVQGTVYESVSNAPLQDVRVTATELGAFTTTDVNGTFRMGLPEGSYNISFQKFGYFDQTIPIVVRLYNGTLQGYVNDTLGSPIAGAAVTIVQANMTVYTDGTGFYNASVKGGRYDVVAFADGYVPGNATVDVPENDTAWANFTLYPNIPAIITGMVFNSANASPVAGAIIWAEGPGFYQGMTDANGSYTLSIDSWNAGTYHVGAFLGGMWPDHSYVTVTPGSITYADFYPDPSDPANVAIYQDWEGQLASLFDANGYYSYDYQIPDAVDLLWNLSAFPVVYWSGFTDFNNTEWPTPQTFAEILYLAQVLGVSVVFGDSFDVWPYGINVLSRYFGDPIGRAFNYSDGNVYFHIVTDHPIFDGVGTNGSTVDIILNLNTEPPFDGDHTWFWGYTGTLLAHVGTDGSGLLGDGVAVREMPGGTEWVLLGSLSPQIWTNLTNDWTRAAMQIAVNAVAFGANNSWATGMGSQALGALPKVDSPEGPSTSSSGGIPPLAYVNLTVYLVKMPSGFVSGTVTDTSGVALEGVRVAAAGTPVYSITDVTGFYMIELPVGNWTITARKFGYQTGTAFAQVLEDETTDLSFVLVPQRRVGIMYDDRGNPLQAVLESTDKFAVMQFADDWEALIAALPGLDVVILSGRPYASVFPTPEQFDRLLATAEGSGTGILFLDNIYGYGSPFGYAAPYGISLLVQYRGDPASRTEPTFCQGSLFEEIAAAHPITRGFAVGDRPQLTSDTCSPFSTFSGFSGMTLGRLWAGYGSPSSLWGDNLAVQTVSGGPAAVGSRWALMGGYAPVFGYGIYWTNAMKQIFVNAAIWASTNPLELTIVPDRGVVGTLVSFAGSGAPVNASLELKFDDAIIGSLSANETGVFSGDFTVPKAVYGTHSVTVQTLDENYAGDRAFWVEPSLTLAPTEGPPSSAASGTGLGFPALAFVDIWFGGTTVGSTLSDSTGSFVATILIPAVRGGDYTVTAVHLDSGAAATASFRVIEEIPLEVQASVGSLHFPGEVVDFLVLVTIRGEMAAADEITATLWYPNGTSKNLATMEIAVGLYKATYTLPGNAPTGTYALVARASVSETYRMGEGAGLATFLVSPTLIAQNAMITSISNGIAQIQTDTGAILLDLDAIDAKLTSIQGTVATISTNIGTLQATVDAINAKITAIQGSVATVSTTLGTIQVLLTSLDAKITDVQGDVATIQSDLGTTQTNVANLQTTGGTLSMSAATIAAIGSIAATAFALMAWRAAGRRPKEP